MSWTDDGLMSFAIPPDNFILLTLICIHGHQFYLWFGSNWMNSYDFWLHSSQFHSTYTINNYAPLNSNQTLAECGEVYKSCREMNRSKRRKVTCLVARSHSQEPPHPFETGAPNDIYC